MLVNLRRGNPASADSPIIILWSSGRGHYATRRPAVGRSLCNGGSLPHLDGSQSVPYNKSHSKETRVENNNLRRKIAVQRLSPAFRESNDFAFALLGRCCRNVQLILSVTKTEGSVLSNKVYTLMKINLIQN